jgi:hypothetical protein
MPRRNRRLRQPRPVIVSSEMIYGPDPRYVGFSRGQAMDPRRAMSRRGLNPEAPEFYPRLRHQSAYEAPACWPWIFW